MAESVSAIPQRYRRAGPTDLEEKPRPKAPSSGPVCPAPSWPLDCATVSWAIGRRGAWLPLALGTLGLLALYAAPLRTRFLNDDYLFLEQARSRPLAQTLFHPGVLENYWRPLSRQIYFAVLAPVADGNALAFHLVNALLFAAALVLLWDLLRAFLPLAGALAGATWFALLPLQRVVLVWISCSQDLLALVGALGGLALFRRRRTLLALAAFLAALASKEAALPLPGALFAWVLLVERGSWKEAARRTAPFAAVALAWTGASLAVTHGFPRTTRFTPADFLAGFVHLVQSLLGLDAPAGLGESLARNGPPLLPLVLLAPLALWYARGAAGDRSAPHAGLDSAPTPSRTLAFAGVWLLAFGLVTGPVAASWSSYYYALAAVGGAMIVGLLLRRGDRWTWLVFVAALLWLHAGTTGVRAYTPREDRWAWTSHLTSSYFERAAALSDTLARQLVRLEPAPAAGTRFFFATLPPGAGFQMGNGALIRQLYGDATLQSWFYSQFSESTAADRPCRFLYWDGARLAELYPRERGAFFQVGTDLLLLGRPAGAVHAFRRGLAEGGDRMDHLYWLGWAWMFIGRRDGAERAWQAFGAFDDSLRARAHLRAAHNALVDGDTLEARRNLIRSIEYAIGRPEAHAVLGELLMASRPKYGALELGVASWLNPRDWMARRGLVLALAGANLDDRAREELAALQAIDPEWRSDSAVVQTWRRLERGARGERSTVRY